MALNLHENPKQSKPSENMLFSKDELLDMEKTNLPSVITKVTLTIIGVILIGSGAVYGIHQFISADDFASMPYQSPDSTSLLPSNMNSPDDLEEAQQAAQDALSKGDYTKAQQYLDTAHKLEQQLKNSSNYDDEAFKENEKAIKELKKQLAEQNANITNPIPQTTYTPPTPNPQCVALRNQYNNIMSQQSAAISAIQTSNANSNYSMTPAQLASAIAAVYAQYSQQLSSIQAQMQQYGC